MNDHFKFYNTPLPFAFDAMEPYIDAKTMQLHHDRHLQAYIDKLNAALENYPEFQSWTLEQLIFNVPSLPPELQTPVQHNAGGVFCHQLYFSNLCNPAPREPSGMLGDAICKQYGSFEAFQEKFKEKGSSLFGSGYVWLVIDATKQLNIITTANQDTPFPLGMCPLLNLDVWEHAYYLKHYNLRNAYINDWFEVINWDQVSTQYWNYQRLISLP